MAKNYPNVLSPIKVGNTVFRNRLICSASAPRFIQGPETYPTEALITHYANKAKSGAAVVTVRAVGQKAQAWLTEDPPPKDTPPRALDLDDEFNYPYLSQLTEAIHFYGAKASVYYGYKEPYGYDVSEHSPDVPVVGPFAKERIGVLLGPQHSGPIKLRREIPVSLLYEIAEDYANKAYLLKRLGFDMIYMHMCYRARLPGRFLSPLTNKRTDQFGGSLENRARFPLMLADKVKERCGRDFIIEGVISGSEPEGGYTLKDACEYAKIFAGHIDLLQIRAGDIEAAHPTGYNPKRTPFLSMAETIKKSGADIKVVAIGGFTDPESCEYAIASRKADFVAGARAWISNPDFGRLVYEGRSEDVVPCLRCNACHISSPDSPNISICAVNPTWGLEHKIERMIEPPTKKKKVAVIGGGPGGMEAAMVAAKRGHSVTLYERSDALGGLLKTCDDVPFKWPQKEFKGFLIRKIGESKIKVLLNTEATPEMLKKDGYDAVLAAVGSEPIVPRIPGVKGKNVFYAPDVYGNDTVLGKNVVIIGGGEVGVEAGIYLAQKGHQVTVLEMLSKLASNAVPIHFYSMFKEAWEKERNFKSILQARCTGIEADKVTYADTNGVEHAVTADSVVIAAGMKPRNDLAMKFHNAGDRLYMIGDCNVVGNVQKAMRSAFSTASML